MPKDLPESAFRFGDWHAEPSQNMLTQASGEVRIEPRLMDLLCLLASESGKVWSRQELMANLWSDTHVGEDALTRAISDLRKVLGDEPRKPRYIATIPKRGYQFLETIASVPSEEQTDEDPQPRSEISLPQPQETTPTPSTAQSERSNHTWLLIAAPLVVILIGLGFFATSGSNEPQLTLPIRAPQEIFLTNYPGRERQPMLSPDGSRIAFVKQIEGFNNIYLVDANGEAERALTDAEADHDNPAWSPDGTRIAYTRQTETGTSIMLVSALGGAQTMLYQTRDVRGLDFSGDGKSLYFAAASAEDQRFQIKQLHLESREATTLNLDQLEGTGQVLPRISPDGKSLAFMQLEQAKSGHLMIIDLEHNQAPRVVRADLSVVGFDWVDNQNIVISNLRNGAYGLWLIDILSGQERWLPTRGEWTFAPSYAQASQSLVYEKVTFEKNIWVLDTASPHDSHRPLVDSNYYDCEAFFSPDGAHILFSSSRSGTLELWQADADGNNLKQLTHLQPAFVTRPRWSADGKQAAFSALKDGDTDIYLVDLTTGQVRKSGAQGMLCDWRQTSNAFYFTKMIEGRSQVFLWDVASESATLFDDSDVFYGQETVDGAWFYWMYRKRDGLWRRALDDPQAEPELIIPDLSAIHADNWGLSNQHVFYVFSENGQTVAVSKTLEGSDNKQIGPLPRIASPSLSVSRDGERLLYARVMRFEVDLILTKQPLATD